MTYRIIAEYPQDDGYTTLVVEAAGNAQLNDHNLLGRFAMQLKNAEEVGLDAIGDANFINGLKREEVFFADIKSAHLTLLLDGREAEGLYIIEHEEDE